MAFAKPIGGSTTPTHRRDPAQVIADDDDAAAQQAGVQVRGEGSDNGDGDGDGETSALDTLDAVGEAFDKASVSLDVDAGKYEALIIEAVLQPFVKGKGQSVRFKYEVADDGDMQGKRQAQWYSILDENKQPMTGLSFLKRDLAMLGFESIKGRDIPEALKQIEHDQPGVSITVKKNDRWTNVYLNGMVEESEIIDSWRDHKNKTNPHGV